MSKIRTAVVGAGQFGRNHLRILKESEQADLAAVVDADPDRAASAAAEFSCPSVEDFRLLEGRVDAAIVAVPTTLDAADGLLRLAISPDRLETARMIIDDLKKDFLFDEC